MLSYLLEFLAWGLGVPSDLCLDTRQCRLSFIGLTHELFWDSILTDLTQRVAALPLSFCLTWHLEKGILVRVCVVSIPFWGSFCIAEFSLSPCFKLFKHIMVSDYNLGALRPYPYYSRGRFWCFSIYNRCGLKLLPFGIWIGSVYAFSFLTYCGLQASSFWYVPNFTHSALHRGIGIPCYFIDGRIPIRRSSGVLRCYRLHPTLTFLISPRSNVLLRIVAARSAGYSQ